jgi:transcription initiation factor TFIID subunit TAF12
MEHLKRAHQVKEADIEHTKKLYEEQQQRRREQQQQEQQQQQQQQQQATSSFMEDFPEKDPESEHPASRARRRFVQVLCFPNSMTMRTRRGVAAAAAVHRVEEIVDIMAMR